MYLFSLKKSIGPFKWQNIDATFRYKINGTPEIQIVWNGSPIHDALMDFRVRIQEIDTSGLFLAPFIYILLATWHCLDKRHENCSATLMINFVWFTAINADGTRLFNSDGKRGGGGRFSAGDVSAHYTPSGPETVKIDGPLSNSIEAQVPIHITDSRLWLDHLFVLSFNERSLRWTFVLV